MKKLCVLLVLILIGAGAFVYINDGNFSKILNKINNKELELKTDQDKFSYLVGINTATSLKTIPMEINKELI